MNLVVNEKNHSVDVPEESKLVWVLRESLHLTGTKFGCGIGACGACTVHLDGKAVRSCTIASGSIRGKITTIEGVPEDHPIKRAWIRHQVPQCGYCQPGQIMQAAALLSANPHPSDEEVIASMNGNLCRCGTYPRILRAIREAAGATA
ncbi:MAG: (2Fe-2S)-binding protein [Candidatus Methylacidiphilaceae bacterium]